MLVCTTTFELFKKGLLKILSLISSSLVFRSMLYFFKATLANPRKQSLMKASFPCFDSAPVLTNGTGKALWKHINHHYLVKIESNNSGHK